MNNFILTPDQELAITALNSFIVNPAQPVFVLGGYSGTGKTTVIKTWLDQLPNHIAAAKLLCPSIKSQDIELTATTNRAVENFSQITSYAVKTIHSLLGLRVNTDYKTGETSLTLARNAEIIENSIILIDEASFIDKHLLKYIFERTLNCKILLIGDSAQLIQFKAKSAVAFSSGFPTVSLTQVVRQKEGNPIIDLATQFRNTVISGKFTKFKPDGEYTLHLDRKDFLNRAIDSCSAHDWHYAKSKLLLWTNTAAISFNNIIRQEIQGDYQFMEGEYAVCNSYFSTKGFGSIKTDQMVQIITIGPPRSSFEVAGNFVVVSTEPGSEITAFMPSNRIDVVNRLSLAKKNDEFSTVKGIAESFIDLRAVYAQTINKSQGATYDEVFIDLDNIKKCHIGDQIARMLYVAVSRARYRVYLTGDFG